MAIQSMDQIINTITSGNFWRADFNKNWLSASAQSAGSWYYLAAGGGSPTVNSVLGATTNLAQYNTSFGTTATADTAALGGSISTTTFTDTTHNSGRFTVGMQLTGTGVADGTYITALGTGTGANNGGTYTVNISQTVTNQTITGTGNVNAIYTGGTNNAVSPATKYLVNGSVFTGSSSGAPAQMLLVDVLSQFTISSVTTTGVQNLTNQSAWPRYADGVGVRAFLVPSVIMGTGTSTVRLNYTNTDGVSGRLTPASPALPTLTSTAAVGLIPHSGTGAGKFAPFIPLQEDDKGIKSVESISFSTSMTSGCMNLIICKPIAYFPITSQGVPAERDFVNQLPSLPVLQDGSNLQWMMMAGAATPTNTAYYGNLETVWG